MRTLLFVLLFLLSAFSISAQQNDYISCYRTEQSDRIEPLNGKCGVLILSMNKNLKINVTNAAYEYSVYQSKPNDNGLCEYIVALSPNDTKKPKLEITRRADVYSTEVVVGNVLPDALVAYTVEEVQKPIRLDDQTKANDVHLNAQEAEVEITTTIENLIIKCSPKLGATVKTKKSENDADVFITTIIIPIAQIQPAQEALNAHAEEYQQLRNREQTHTATDADFDRLDEIEKEMAVAKADLLEIGTIDVSTDGSNHLPIDVSKVGPRSKYSIAVLPLVKEIEKYVTEAAAYVSEAGRLFSQRRYPDARAAYVSALESADVDLSMRPTIMTNINDCDTCIAYVKRANFSLGKLRELRQSPSANQQEVARYASAASDFFKKLNELNHHEYYANWIEKLDQIMEDMPLSISFTAVEWRTLSEGNLIPNVEVWTYTGEEPLTPSVLQSPKKYRKLLEKQSSDFKQVGTTDVNGKAEIEIVRKNLPKGFVFCPVSDEDIKIYYLSLGELMREASGTYVKKQFRLKMYKRTNKYF